MLPECAIKKHFNNNSIFYAAIKRDIYYNNRVEGLKGIRANRLFIFHFSFFVFFIDISLLLSEYGAAYDKNITL